MKHTNGGDSMNFIPGPGNNPFCDRRPDPNPTPPITERRRRLDGLEEGDPILVQTPAGICEQGVFLRIEDGFLIWVRNVSGNAFITVTSLNEITITKL